MTPEDLIQKLKAQEGEAFLDTLSTSLKRKGYGSDKITVLNFNGKPPEWVVGRATSDQIAHRIVSYLDDRHGPWHRRVMVSGPPEFEFEIKDGDHLYVIALWVHNSETEYLNLWRLEGHGEYELRFGIWEERDGSTRIFSPEYPDIGEIRRRWESVLRHIIRVARERRQADE